MSLRNLPDARQALNINKSQALLASTDPIRQETLRKPDIGLAKRVLDWTPRIALDDGLRRAIAYFRGSSCGAA